MVSYTAIDQWLIIRIFEPVAWRIERATGLNQFGLARYVLAVLLAGDFAAFFLVPRQHSEPVSYVGILIALVALTAAVIRSRISEDKAVRRNDNDHETSGGSMERAIFWGFTLYLMLSSLTSPNWQTSASYRDQMRLFLIGNAAYLAFLYFCACRMKPPEYGLEPSEARS